MARVPRRVLRSFPAGSRRQRCRGGLPPPGVTFGDPSRVQEVGSNLVHKEEPDHQACVRSSPADRTTEVSHAAGPGMMDGREGAAPAHDPKKINRPAVLTDRPKRATLGVRRRSIASFLAKVGRSFPEGSSCAAGPVGPPAIRPTRHVWTVLSIAARLCVCAAFFLLPSISSAPDQGRLLPEQRRFGRQQSGRVAVESTRRSQQLASEYAGQSSRSSVVISKGVPITKRSGSRSDGDFCVSRR